MSLAQLLNVGWSGIWLGTLYGAIGVGLVLSFRSARLVNLSLGPVLVFGGMLAAWVQTHGGTTAGGVLAASAAGAALSLAQETAMLRRLRGASGSMLLLATLSASIIVAGLIVIFFGRDPVTGEGLVGGSLSLGGWSASWDSIVFVAVVVGASTLLWAFAEASPYGKAVSASGHDPAAAAMLGIDVRLLRSLVMGLTGGLVGLAGGLFLPLAVLDFSIGLRLTLFGFVAGAVFGYESLPGALLGGWLFGLLDAFGTAYVSSVFSEAVAFGALLVLIVAGRRLLLFESILRWT